MAAPALTPTSRYGRGFGALPAAQGKLSSEGVDAAVQLSAVHETYLRVLPSPRSESSLDEAALCR